MMMLHDATRPCAADRKLALAEATEDRVWFAARRDRQYRVRRASPAEARVMWRNPVPPGMAVFVAVHQLAPGVRMRGVLVTQSGLRAADLTDAQAKALYEQSGCDRVINRRMRRALKGTK